LNVTRVSGNLLKSNWNIHVKANMSFKMIGCKNGNKWWDSRDALKGKLTVLTHGVFDS
jgi:hypothetical protein